MINVTAPSLTYRSPEIQYGDMVTPNIDFRIPQAIETDFSLLGVSEKFMAGAIQGFTTVNLSKRQPDNVAEGLAQSLGTWLGITGMLFTGPGAWGTRLLAMGGARGVRMATAMSKSSFRSVPMWVGDKAVKSVRNLQNTFATPGFRNAIRANSMHMDALEGGIRIGTAMGVMNWQEGIDGMLLGGGMGVFFGASDRLIGNAVRGMRPQLKAAIGTNDPVRLRRAERAVSAISAGIVSGMPSTIMGQPWEYQVYDYLFGAWLGAEPSYVMRTAHSFVGKMRANGKESTLMDPRRLRADKDYRDLMKRNRNKDVRDGINEEITAQVEFALGQKVNNANRASVIAAIAHSAAEAGNISAEKAIELNQAIYSETLDGMFIQEGLNKFKSEAMGQGLSSEAADAYAVDRIRQEYADWISGDNEGTVLQEISENIRAFDPEKTDYELFKPVSVNDEIGIITQMDTQGVVRQVLASDGIELVSNSKPVSKDDLIAKRGESSQVVPMTRNELVNKIVAWRFRVDDQGQYMNQGTDADPLDVDPRMWDIYPDVAANYLQPNFKINEDGSFTPQVTIGNRKLSDLPGSYPNEQKAYKAALEYLSSSQAQRRLQRDPSVLYDSTVLGKLAEAYSSMDYDAKSPQLFTMVKDIVSAMDASGKITEASEIYSRPIALYNKIYKTLQKTRDRDLARQAAVRELYKAQKDQSENASVRVETAKRKLEELTTATGHPVGWKGFLAEMAQQYPMKDSSYWSQDNPTVKDLRKWYKRQTYEQINKSLAILNGRLQKVDLFPNGQRNITLKAPSLLERTIREIDPSFDVIAIDKAWDRDSNSVVGLSGYRADTIDGYGNPAKRDWTLEDMNQMLDDAYQAGDLSREYYVYSGVKDKDTLRAVPYMFSTRGSAIAYLNKRIGALKKSNSALAKEIANATKKAEDTFIRQFASNMRIWEKLNADITNGFRYPIELLATQPGFINTVAGFNKRLQILDAEGMIADPEFYTNPDGSQKTSFKAAIIRAQNSDGSPQATGIKEFRNRGNIDPNKLADQHRDGSVIVNQRTFDQLSADGGLEDLSGAIKGITGFSDPNGGFLAKYAFFRADDTTQAFMESNGLDFLHNTTTAKQSGQRKIYDFAMDSDGNASFMDSGKPVENPELFDIPIDGVTINSGQSESISSAMKPKRIPIQKLQAWSAHIMDPAVAKATINEVMDVNNITSESASMILAQAEGMEIGRFDEPLSKKALESLRQQASTIRVDDLSTADIFRIMKGGYGYEQSGIYDRVIRDIYASKDEMISDIANDGDMDSALNLLSNEFSSQLDVLIQVTDASGDLLTGGMLQSRGLKQYADAVLRNYVVNRTMRPKVDYAIKSIGSPQDAGFLQKFGRVEEGEFMLGQAARNMKVRVGMKDTTLGEAYDRLTDGTLDVEIRLAQDSLNKLGQEIEAFSGTPGKTQLALQKQWNKIEKELRSLKAEKKYLDQAMEMVVTRVPIEHASGQRVLRFKGFSDESGVTSKLNPRDMENLGGMDLDIDSVFIFQNLGKTKYRATDGSMQSALDQLKKSQIKDYWYGEDGVFRDPKSPEMQKLWKAKYDTTRNLADMFNPDKLFEAGRATASANQSLGQIVNARRDLIAALEKIPSESFSLSDMDITPKMSSRLAKMLGDDFTVTFTKKDNAEAIIDEVARAGINMSADAADLTSFIGKFEIKPMMHAQAYDIKIKTSKKLKAKDRKRVESMLRSHSPTMKRMQQANALLSGRYKTEGNLNAFEVGTQLKKINTDFRDYNRRNLGEPVGLNDLGGSYYKGLDSLMKADLSYRPMDEYSMQRLNNFFKVAKAFTKANSNIAKLYKDTLKTITGTARGVYPDTFFKFLEQYNTTVRNFHNGTGADLLDVREAYTNMQDMLANEVNDLASAMMLYKEHYRLVEEGITIGGKKVKITSSQLAQIFNTTSEFKRAIYEAKDPALKGQRRFENADLAMQNWGTYRAGIQPELRRFADYAMLSTLFKPNGMPPTYDKSNPKKFHEWHQKAKWTNHTHQGETMQHMTPLHVREFMMMHRHIWEIPKQVPDKDVEITVGNQTKTVPAVEAHLRKMIEDPGVSEDGITFPYDYYETAAPKRVDMRIAAIKNRVENQYQSIRNDQIAENGHPVYMNIVAQKSRIIKELGDYMKAGNEFKLNGEEQMLFTELRDLFSKHPQISDHFDRVFLGELAMTRRDGKAKHLENANLDDLRKFVAVVKGHYHGEIMNNTPLKDKVPKWMYWMMPDKYHRQYAAIDLKLDDVIIHTIDGTTEKAKVISSPAKRLVSGANTMQMNSVIRQNALNEKVNEYIQPISDAMGPDFDTAFRFVVMDRIVKAGKASEYVVKSHNTYRKQLAKIQNNSYELKSGPASFDEMLIRIDEAITRANKLTWKIVHNPKEGRYYYDKSKKWINSDVVMSRMSRSIIKGDYNDLWIPDTWTLNNMILSDYVHKKLIKSEGTNVPVKGSEAWVVMANRYIENAGMADALDLPRLPFEEYFPQRNHSKAALAKWQIDRKQHLASLQRDTHLNSQYAAMRLHEDFGRLNPGEEDGIMSELIGVVTDKRRDLDVGESRLPGHLRHRSKPEEQIPDWDPGVRSYYEYMDSIVSNNMSKALALFGKKQIDDLEVSLKMNYQGKGKHYADFLRLYLSDQIMTQTMVPTSWVDNYASLNLKSSGYYYFTDRYFTELDQKIAKKLGRKPLLGDNDPERSLRLAELSNLEAKYSLLTLLSRPKALVMNTYGGTTILASDVGVTAMKKGWSLKEIQKVNPEITNWEDAVRFAEKNGAMESLVRNEVMENQAWGNTKSRRGLSAMLEAIKSDPAVDDLKLMEIAKRHGLSDSVMNLAAFPMRYSERILRSRSFFAHYIRAVDALEITGPSAYNHPYALEMARRGVATSQFMYNNANRPAWTRSNVGKIVSRFKLWAMKSVQFRADAFNEMTSDMAYNITDGKSQERFNNIMMMDLFMIGLAGLFPFSIFGNSIPEPYGWMSDLVDWAFGDPDEKANAFRGGGGLPQALAPLQVGLPASSRLLTSWIEPVLSQQDEQMASYVTWTLFPFGLLARDMRNAYNNPTRAVDSLLGIPLADAIGAGYGDISRVRNESILPASL